MARGRGSRTRWCGTTGVDAVLLRQPQLPCSHRSVPRRRLHQRGRPVRRAQFCVQVTDPGEHRQRLLKNFDPPRQLAGCNTYQPARLQHREPLTPSAAHCGSARSGTSPVAVVSASSRRGCDRGRQSADQLRPSVPGPEPGEGTSGCPRLPVPGARRQPADRLPRCRQTAPLTAP